MVYRRPIDEKTKAAAVKAMHDKSLPRPTLTALAKQFGVTTTTLRMWDDPEYARKRKDSINQARRIPVKPYYP